MVLGIDNFLTVHSLIPIFIRTFISIFYLDFYFPFLFGLFFPFSVWSFISRSIILDLFFIFLTKDHFFYYILHFLPKLKSVNKSEEVGRFLGRKWASKRFGIRNCHWKLLFSGHNILKDIFSTILNGASQNFVGSCF